MNPPHLSVQPTKEEMVFYGGKAQAACNGVCRENCPLNINIPQILSAVKNNDFQQARDLLDQDNPFPSLCGRFCSAPCTSCHCASGFKAIERYLGDNFEPTAKKTKPGKYRVTIIGAGVSGLTVASVLHHHGIPVKILEATDSPGGLHCKTTPEFRLPHAVASHEVGRLAQTVQLVTHTVGGSTITLEEISKDSHAVVIATGANKPAFLGIPGEHLGNVLSATDYLALPPRKARDATVVIGGTMRALDCARVARRSGEDVTLIYPHDTLPIDPAIISAARKEGVQFMTLTQPLRILGRDNVTGVECNHMMLEESEDGDTQIPMPIDGSEFTIPCSRAIIAIGLEPNPTIGRYTSVRTVGKGRVWTNEYHQTSVPNVFAAGEIALGAAPIEHTLAHAKECAQHVIDYLSGRIRTEE